jgi:signal transduction histidine kinase
MSGGQVEVRVFRENDQVRVDVSDTGIGIDVADQPYLFTSFFRSSHQSTFNVAGVGLGLFITRSLVEAHEGKVWAESELDAGSTFSVALPLLTSETVMSD